MNKLKCFRCNHRFHYYRKEVTWNNETKHYDKKMILKKDQIYRDEYGLPICPDCMEEVISEYWEEPYVVMDDLINYNYSYQKYMANQYEVECPNIKCGVINSFNLNNDNCEHTCWDCPCYFFTKDHKVTDWWENEDKYIEEGENK